MTYLDANRVGRFGGLFGLEKAWTARYGGELSAFHAGEFPAPIQAEIAQHVATCRECADFIDSFATIF